MIERARIISVIIIILPLYFVHISRSYYDDFFTADVVLDVRQFPVVGVDNLVDQNMFRDGISLRDISHGYAFYVYFFRVGNRG